MIALDCQTFGGAFSLGVARAGFKIIGKREGAAGFGVPMYRDNTDLLGVDPSTIQTDIPAAWETADVDLIFGNPACSGFSSASTCVVTDRENGYRGIDSPANQGMWDFINLGSCNPTIAIFESVPGAYGQGHELMRTLRTQLEAESGEQYALHHVLHNNSALGGCAERKRYFFVASRVPFGVDQVTLERTLTLRDRIGDLENSFDPSIGHVVLDGPRSRRLSELASNVEWNADESAGIAFERARKQGVELVTWNREKPGVDSRTSLYAARRWNYDKPARVIRQYACAENVHPTQPRCFTFREAARIMGLPDNWSVQAAVENRANGQAWFGKGIPVESGQWIATWAAASINGQPGPITGTVIGDREYLIDVRKPKLSMYANMDRLFDE
jgi:site-specific DNA-cytosine methylase